MLSVHRVVPVYWYLSGNNIQEREREMRVGTLRTVLCDSEVQVHDVAADPVSSRTIWTCLLTQLRERVVCYVLMCRNIHCRSTSTPPQSMHLVRSILHLDVDRNLQHSDRCKSFRDVYLLLCVRVWFVFEFGFISMRGRGRERERERER